MSKLDDLIVKFEKFPGIGARQARRFAFHVLRLEDDETKSLASLISSLKEEVTECKSCGRYFAKNGGSSELCSICSDSNRDRGRLLVVSQDADIQSIERSGVYDGLYFVLGGTVPLLNSKESEKLRSGKLKATIEARFKDGLSEVILGFAVNPDGENTAKFVESLIEKIDGSNILKVSHLGRGLSTGSELEYADSETIKNALRNRT